MRWYPRRITHQLAEIPTGKVRIFVSQYIRRASALSCRGQVWLLGTSTSAFRSRAFPTSIAGAAAWSRPYHRKDQEKMDGANYRAKRTNVHGGVAFPGNLFCCQPLRLSDEKYRSTSPLLPEGRPYCSITACGVFRKLIAMRLYVFISAIAMVRSTSSRSSKRARATS